MDALAVSLSRSSNWPGISIALRVRGSRAAGQADPGRRRGCGIVDGGGFAKREEDEEERLGGRTMDAVEPTGLA